MEAENPAISYPIGVFESRLKLCRSGDADLGSFPILSTSYSVPSPNSCSLKVDWICFGLVASRDDSMAGPQESNRGTCLLRNVGVEIYGEANEP